MHDMYLPSTDDLAGWVRLLDESRWMGIHELIWLHKKLHALFGDKPNDALLDGERKMSNELRSYGIEHRYMDALSDAAGTKIDSPAPPTLEELHYYLQELPVHSGIVKLMQGVDSPAPVFALIDETMLPDGMGKVILKQINKMMPPGVVIKALPKKPKEEFAREMRAYNLELSTDSRSGREVAVVPWKQVVASAPASVLKSDSKGDKSVEVKVKVTKSTEPAGEYSYFSHSK